MKNDNAHMLWMILGCTLPLFLIFALPLLGIRQGLGLLLFILLFFVIHLFMTRGHDHQGDNNQTMRG